MRLLHVLFFLSGCAGLGYQIVWTGQFAVGLGHEMPSLLAVVTAFLGGLAIGAWALDRRIGASSRPGRWYAVLEIAIGLWALGTPLLIGRLNALVATWIGVDPAPARQWLVAFAVPFVAFLPATAAMGATLPAMDRFLSRLRRRGRSIGGLYAANTLGAAAGVLGTTFVIVPALGYTATTLVLAAVNLLCAIAVLAGPARGEASREPVHDPIKGVSSPVPILAILFLTGLLGIGYEVLAVRVMAQVLQNTVYSYASALAVYLIATSLGAGAYQAIATRVRFRGLLESLLLSLGASCLLGVVIMARAPAVYSSSRRFFGGDQVGAIGAEMVLALAVFGVPSLLMGAAFSHLAQAARRARHGVGGALALNTVGGALAPVIFGIILLPAAGPRVALLAIGAGYAGLVLLAGRPRLDPLWHAPPLALAAMLLVPALQSDLRLIDAVRIGDHAGKVVAYREGVMAAVAVVDDPDGDLYLKVNNEFMMGGTKKGFAERREAHVPLLLHPDPRRALVLGIGTGITLGAAAQHPGLEIEAVELLPEVVELMPFFDGASLGPAGRENVTIHVADARRHVRVARGPYDLIVAEVFHPARDGSAWLYTVEHFTAIRALLGPGGFFCQWLPLYQLDHDTLRLIVRTFLAVFPQARAFMAHYNAHTPIMGLIGAKALPAYRAGWHAGRVGDALGPVLVEPALPDDFALFGCFMAGRAELDAFAGPGPLNRDDLPLLRFRAPAFAYSDHPESWSRLLTLIDAHTGDVAGLFGPDPDESTRAFADRLRLYIDARNAHLRASIDQLEGRLDEAIEGYLAAAGISRDFSLSYLFCVQIAAQMAATDRPRAREILERLVEIRPERREARVMLRRVR